MNNELRRGQVIVNVDFQGERGDWIDRLIALGEFLHETCTNKDEEVHIAAYEDQRIGGLRISEVSFILRRGSGGMSGSSYMSGDPAGKLMLAYCESFLATYGDLPYRPPGWESCINLHGEARVGLLDAMGLPSSAEYQRQLAEEATIQ